MAPITVVAMTVSPAIGAGTWPDWLAAIGTVGTLLLALILFWRERSQRLRDEKDKLVRRARLVIPDAAEASGTTPDEGNPSLMIELRVRVRNYSTDPVLYVSVRVAGYPDLIPRTIRAIAPQDGATVVWNQGDGILANAIPCPATSYVDPDLLELTFTDGDGYEWRRRGLSAPSRITKSDLPAWARAASRRR